MDASDPMQYARREDSNGSVSVSTHTNSSSSHFSPYQHNQNLSQALLHTNAPPHHSPLFSVHPSPIMKRKLPDPISTSHLPKRRRDDDPDTYDADNGQGAKHWTDDEKTRLFKWLMGPGQDEHWSALRATKNSCLRECAFEVFENKKTYQALKGCYERNFAVFKQIYAFEMFHANAPPILPTTNEADRIREYERRLQSARKTEMDIGNVSARTVDHWHRIGWYSLFYQRWHGDPATTRPSQSRTITTSGSNQNEEPDTEDHPHLTFSEPISVPNGMNPDANSSMPTDRNGHPLTYINPQSLREPPPAISPLASSAQHPRSAAGPGPSQPMSSSSPSSAATAAASAAGPLPSNLEPQQPMLNLVIPQAMLQAYLQYLQVQTQTSKMKLEYMRRREEREEKDSALRREAERSKMDREAQQFDLARQKERTQQRTDRALELLRSDSVDESVKQVAKDFLKTFFTAD